MSNLPSWLNRRNAIIGVAAAAIAALLAGIALLGYLFLVVRPRLPELDAVIDYKPKIPLRVYTADKVLIGEFGEEHRDFVPVQQMPAMMKKAVLAIEDTRFYEHGGVDWLRVPGSVLANLSGSFRQGGSTISMQVARNFYLTREKVISRKLNEVMLAFKIEDALTKDQILELYMNQIYLGQRTFGFGAAAQTYFDKPLSALSIAEIAMLAGLPKNPARHNPITNFKRAKLRQQVVLRRLLAVGYITDAQYRKARAETLRVSSKGQDFAVHAEYVAELARQAAFTEFQEAAYTRGIVVRTTIVAADQEAAYQAVRRNVIAYDQRHGYRGPEAFIALPEDEAEREEEIDRALARQPVTDGLIAAVVLAAGPREVRAELADGTDVTITGDGLKLAAAALSPKAKDGVRIRPGAVIRVSRAGKKGWAITQVPKVAAAFASMDPLTGAYRAMVGGFDYSVQKLNHVTQAWRQPGSAIKPFVYSAAVEKGYGPATLIDDVPLELPGGANGEPWRPQNDDFVFDGPISMRISLAKSKNVPSVRILRAISVPYAHAFLGRFGLDLSKHPQNLTMALGTGAVTPEQMAGAYAVFANGGYRIRPYLVASIEDASGKVLRVMQRTARPEESARVLDPRNAFLMDSMLHEVARTGTGAAAVQRIGRPDIAGKTGTTSDAFDGWFGGYGGGIVAVAWMGYDEPKSLGGREFGSTLALPIWIDYMRSALAGRPIVERPVPEGVVQMNDDWVLEEYAGDPAVRTIDIDPATLDGAAPAMPDDGSEPAPVQAPVPPEPQPSPYVN
ncbi:penicillin-binding protein 1A [Pseudoduganella umbonata]|uniref:Penicillin-binding protein 1A n=1 Tax=Pseudoduganella umbonata TaxID=864828 RepID=A0A4P8HJN1_9BURK|nr:PBP1A family penicillin-binding protein [Pseudoduganella umbonata]MBB3219706.1 penicillin-binding protein 1A [Pseudoduganella umbonata]QCP09757.1 PBP1A family penicillin-binding protein [Pseudoduganella umbonata]